MSLMAYFGQKIIEKPTLHAEKLYRMREKGLHACAPASLAFSDKLDTYVRVNRSLLFFCVITHYSPPTNSQRMWQFFIIREN